jgi:hypothetical protein
MEIDAGDHDDVRTRVLALFEQHRRCPGAPFEPARFLGYLMADASGQPVSRDSFAGRWRFYAFIEAVQLAFSVCYSIADLEANPSLDAFVQRTRELMASRRSSLASLRHQGERGFGAQVLFVLDVLAFPVVAALHRWPVAFAVALVALALLNGAFAWLYLRYRRYHTRLWRQLRDGGAG